MVDRIKCGYITNSGHVDVLFEQTTRARLTLSPPPLKKREQDARARESSAQMYCCIDCPDARDRARCMGLCFSSPTLVLFVIAKYGREMPIKAKQPVFSPTRSGLIQICTLPFISSEESRAGE